MVDEQSTPKMTVLERDYPDWHEFLMWHNEVIKRYPAAVRMELWSKARDFVSRMI